MLNLFFDEHAKVFFKLTCYVKNLKSFFHNLNLLLFLLNTMKLLMK